MKTLILSLILLALLPSVAQAKGIVRVPTPDAEVQSYVKMAETFWFDRGVQACPGGIRVEWINESATDVARGGYCRIVMNHYWMAPNAWAMDAETLCTVVFHEVHHALPGGTEGGIDGHGHTAGGIMGVPISATPSECRQGVSHREFKAAARSASRKRWRSFYGHR